MCIIAAKYIKNIGWVLAKNRDQDYIANISFIDEDHPKVGEVMCLYDHHTKYKEGMNHNGMAIMTTSLTPILSSETDEKDGQIIYKALQLSSQEEAATYIINNKLTGFIFIATKDKLILIEAAKDNQGKGNYKSIKKIIPISETIVRTNHGIDIPWAGFQYGIDEKQDFWRKSSETRKSDTEKVIKTAKTPEEMLDKMASKMNENLQLNLFRVETKPRQLRTIFQWALSPGENKVYIRPVQTKLKIKIDPEKIKVKMLDNGLIKSIYHDKIKHIAKIVKKDHFYKTVQLESFKNFINNR